MVDYGLCNNNIFKDIRYFCVGQPNHLSDHAFITCSIETNNSCNLEKLECIVTSPFPNGFKWFQHTARSFSEALRLPTIQKMLSASENDINVNNLCENMETEY